MDGLTKAVEEHVGNEMPDKFGLMLDGWTHGSEHYLAVFGCYETRAGPRYPLLSLAPIIIDATGRFDAESHMAALSAFLPFFGKELSSGVFLLGDNCAVNMRLARLIGVPLVGSAIESRSPDTTGPTRKGPRASPVTDEAPEDTDPSGQVEVTPTADIVHSPHFESGVVKVLGGHESDLSRAEKEALRPFRQMISRIRSPEKDPTKLGFADRILKRRKVHAETSAYVMLSAIPPTSNKVERLFSMAARSCDMNETDCHL
ncbi:unnamed protein product [Phytophthora lilii]|uniref:Unnamed protein product n=1 Tax=Phytophthora lilii TaxID=2077276 RepID=A0A9W6U1I9_9STRA|nr:unnamed protein product [Phytophthora lilii]